MSVAFVDLKRQYITYKAEIDSAIKKVFSDASFIDGPIVQTFENSFAKYCNKKFCVSLNSGTDALFFALLAYGISKGDEVITAPNSYFSSAMVISNIGAVPIFVDVNEKTGLIDPKAIEKAITKKTRAIMPVHITGLPADMESIAKIARKYKLIIIEDCCQSHGATIGGKKTPYTDTGAFSFYPGKNLGAFGDGGALVTDNARIADLIRHLRNDGSVEKYVHTMFGYKSRLDSLQAAVLSAKLKHLDSWTAKRQRLATLYTQRLRGITHIKTPIEVPYGKGVYHLYQIQAKHRDELKTYLEKQGISTVIHYPTPIHLNKPYRDLGYKPGMYPITEERAKKVLALPMFAELKEREIEHICLAVKKFYDTYD